MAATHVATTSSDSAQDNVSGIVFSHARSQPTRTAVRGPLGDDRLDITRAQLAGLVARRAEALAAAQQPGERIVLVCPTTPEFVVEFFAAQAAGLVVVPVNPLSTRREPGHFLADSGAGLVLAHPSCTTAAQTAADPADVVFAQIALLDSATVSKAGEADWGAFTPVSLPGEAPAGCAQPPPA